MYAGAAGLGGCRWGWCLDDDLNSDSELFPGPGDPPSDDTYCSVFFVHMICSNLRCRRWRPVPRGSSTSRGSESEVEHTSDTRSSALEGSKGYIDPVNAYFTHGPKPWVFFTYWQCCNSLGSINKTFRDTTFPLMWGGVASHSFLSPVPVRRPLPIPKVFCDACCFLGTKHILLNAKIMVIRINSSRPSGYSVNNFLPDSQHCVLTPVLSLFCCDLHMAASVIQVAALPPSSWVVI